MIAVAAPAAPAIPFALLALSSAIAFVVSWGLLHGWARTFGALFQWLGKKGIDVAIRAAPDIHIHPFSFLLTLDQQVRFGLGQAVAATEHAMVTSFHKLIGIILWSAQETAGLATDAFNAIRGVEHSTVTHIAKVVTHTVVKPITKTITVTKGISATVARQLTARVKALEHRVAHLAHVGAGAVAAPFPRLGRIEKTVKAQSKRLTRLEKILAGGLGVAVVLRALSKLGLGWLRCSNVSKAGKSVCKMDPTLLEALLLDAALLAGAFSLVEFAKALQPVEGVVADAMHTLITEF